jgi:predicted Zn-dependent peptidase
MSTVTLPTLPHVAIATTRLDNGVTVVTAPLPHHARCHVFVQLRGGPVHEDDDTWGLSHVVEHMVFRGTKRHKDARAVGLAADDFGGDLGAATYRDRVTFDTRCDPDRVDDALALLADMLGAPRFEGLETELGIIEEELAELYDDDGQEIDPDNASFRQIFAGDVLARSIEGSIGGLKKVTKKRLEKFHDVGYRGGNVVVSVAGPVEHGAVVAAAQRSMGRLQAGGPPPRGTAPKIHEPHARDVAVVRTEDAQTSVRLTFPVVGFASPSSTVASVLARIIDDGPASRLQQEVIDRDGLAYSAWGLCDLYETRGMLELAGQVRHERVATLVEAFAAQVTALAKSLPAQAELDRVVRRVARDARDLLDEPAALAEAVGKAGLFGQPFDLAAQVARTAAVERPAVRALARTLAASPRVVLVGLPRKKDVVAVREVLERLRADAADM